MQEKFNIKFYKSIKKIFNFGMNVFFDYEVNGIENIPKKPYILAGNHKSIMDIPILISSVDDEIHFMAKKELFDSKILELIFRKMGAFPVDRNNVDIKAIKESLRILKQEQVLGIFPEGHRNKTDELILPFKSGVSNLALKTNSLIVPFGINGEYKFRSKIKLNIGKPIDIKKIDSKNQNLYLEEEVKKLILK